MPIDQLPGQLSLPSRSQLVAKMKGWALVRNPAEDTRPGSQVDQDANVWADAGTMVLSKVAVVGGATTRANMVGQQLDDEAARLGTARLPAYGAGGAVAITTVSTGAYVAAGDVATYLPTGLTYQVTASGIYQNGSQVPVSCTSTGPSTNLPPGAQLTWRSQRPGVVGGTATVVAQADGSGLSGGAPAESDDDLRKRLDYLAANPPASGNDSEYQATAADVVGVSVQQIFTYPAILGPGTTCLVPLLRPASPGGNRIPNATQLAQILQQTAGSMPGSDGIFMGTVVASPTTVALKVVWAIGAASWADSTTFPLYHASPNLVAAAPNAGGVLSPTTFRLTSTAMTEVPQVGQSVGFYDVANLVFRRKKILTVTVISATAYDVTVDTANGLSDTGYTPVSGQACCPWSDSLNSLVTPVVTYFDTLGPGEQVGSFFDPGLRQRRSPPSPQYWPNTITMRLLGGAAVPLPPSGAQQNQPPVQTLLTSPSLQDVVLVEPAAIPFPTPTGTPGVSSFLLTLGASFVVFPE